MSPQGARGAGGGHVAACGHPEQRRGVAGRGLEQNPGSEDPGKPSDWPKSASPGFPE